MNLCFFPAIRPNVWKQFSDDDLLALLTRRFQIPVEVLKMQGRLDLEQMAANSQRALKRAKSVV